VLTQVPVREFLQTIRIVANVPAGTVRASSASATHRRSILSVRCSVGLVTTYFMSHDRPTWSGNVTHFEAAGDEISRKVLPFKVSLVNPRSAQRFRFPRDFHIDRPTRFQPSTRV
jgi:hypothetical protein